MTASLQATRPKYLNCGELAVVGYQTRRKEFRHLDHRHAVTPPST
jgi:hypothetical protein